MRQWRPPMSRCDAIAVAARVVGVVVLAMAALTGTAAAAKFQVTDAGGGVFPQRALLLSGQGIPSLTARNVHVIENGTGVHNLAIKSVTQSSGRTFGVVV